MTILAVDIGNTNIHLGIVENRQILERVTFATDDVDWLVKKASPLLDELADPVNTPVVICSVVPNLTAKVARRAEATVESDVLVIGEDIPLPLKLDLRNPDTVGADRVVAAAMAFERMGGPVIVADFGSAITIDCVSNDGIFLGGAILPGLNLSASALANQTAALPLVELAVPETPWGRDTAEAISAGIIFGALGALREITERYAEQLGQWPEVIATGGDAPLIAKHCDFIHAVVPDLVLMGIELAYDVCQTSPSQ